MGILGERLAAVQAVIYLIFNEGYAASGGRELVRQDLCAEAIRLGRLLCQLLPDEPENLGLLGLMLLQDSRLVVLDEPFNAVDDRTVADLIALVHRWLQTLAAEGAAA